MYIRLFIHPLVLPLSIILILLGLYTVQNTLAQISAYRSEIKIIADTGSSVVINRQVQLTTTADVTGAIASSSDLFDEVQQRTINASKITVTPNIFDVNQIGPPVLLNVEIDASNANAGVYTGRLLITQGSAAPVIIPVTLTLHDPEWIALVLVVGGIISAVIVQLTGQKPTESLRAQHKATTFRAKAFEAARLTGGWRYLALIIVVIVGVLAAWQAYFPNLSTFGRSWIDYAAAYLSGFGSQAIVNAVVNAVKRT
jgi:hypothetical protein